MRALTQEEVSDVSGGILANIGMGMAGATAGMALYSLGNWSNLTGRGFVISASGGFVTGALGFSPAAQIAGAGVAGMVGSAMDDREDS